MIIESVYLRNIRSYKEADIDLNQGISLIEGDVGSGKSTILMAIEFAFFGLGNQRGESLLRKDETKGEVILNFEVEDEPGIIKRVLQRADLTGKVTQGKGMLYYRGEKLELSPSELKERILEIIDFKEDVNPRANSHIFRYAVYTPQEEMKEIINQRPDARMQTLRKAFGIEKYKIAAENAGLLIKSFKEEQSYLSGKMEIREAINEDLNEWAEGKENNLKIANELEVKKDKTEQTFELLKKDINEVQSLEQEKQTVLREIGHYDGYLRNNVKSLTEYKQSLEELEDYKNKIVLKRIRELKDKIDKSDENIDGLEEKIEYVDGLVKKKLNIESKREVLDEKLNKVLGKMGVYANATITRLKSELEKKDNKLIDLTGEIEGIKEEIVSDESLISFLKHGKDEKTEIWEQINNAAGECPVCRSELSEEKIAELESKIDDELEENRKEQIETKKHLDKIKSDLKKKTKQLEDVKGDISELKIVKQKAKERDELENEIEKGNNELEGLELPLVELGTDTNGFGTLEDYLKHLKSRIDEAKELKYNKKMLESAEADLEKTNMKIEELIDKVNNQGKAIDGLKETKKELQGKLENIMESLTVKEISEEEYENIESELNKLTEELIECRTFIKNAETQESKLLEELEKLDLAKKQFDIIDENMIWLKDFFIPTVELIEKNILSELFIDFNENFKKWFDMLVDDETKSARLDIDFTPIVEQGGLEQDISYLSGGEKTSVALAYRLALNKLVKKVSVGMETNLLILDEPTDGLSKEQLFRLREILDEMECSQIILVSHERELEGFADSLLEIQKENGISKIKEAE